MPGPISSTTPPIAPGTPAAPGTPTTPPAPGAAATDAVATPKATGVASLTVDGVDITKGALGVQRVQPAGASEAVAGIQSQFPLDDLSLITSEDRYAQGFRLDSGSLRLMWMSARRTSEADGSPGFEIFFQAHGAAVERYKHRLEQAGATSGSFNFFAADPDPASEPGKSVLKRNGQKWNPSASTLTLSQAGKWSVDFAPGAPEAIKGAMRIRVQGTDADATKALKEVITKLGLQSAFAPPAPAALEKLKIMRLLWQISPGSADRLRFRPREDLAGLAELKTAAQEADATASQAIDGADLGNSKVADRARLAMLLYETSPRAFLTWATSDSSSVNGILPSSSSSDPNSALNTALTGAGVPQHGDAHKAAMSAPLDDAGARAVLRLGLLAKKAATKASDLAGRDVEGIKLTELQDLCAELGVSEARIAGLQFKEVYPGYFTVVDPMLSPELEKLGARYLYSTADNAERVWQMLSGGQKSSLTRFQEGLLIQGKSSSSDFDSGGASSVFSRLVTDSVIGKMKRGESGTDTSFYDWSGSRPYKLIINRSILDRTDWYAYNGDNFGRTTTLKPDNHGATIVRTINGAYSRSNEVCFPIGNDTAYVDYVACSTDKQKADLITMLESKGIKEWHGKSLDDLILVTNNKLIEHPDDVTLLSSIRDAIMANGLADAVKAARPAVEAVVTAKIDAEAPALVKAVATAQASSAGRSSLESNLSSTARNAASGAVTASTELVKALDVDAAKDKLRQIALDAAKASARTQIDDVSSYSTYTLDSTVRPATEVDAQKVAEEVATATLAKLVAEATAPADSSPASRQAVRDALDAALRAAVRTRLIEKATTDGAEAARTKAESMVISNGPSDARYTAQQAARDAVGDAAVAAAPADALAALLAAVEDATRTKLEETALATLKDRGPGWIRSAVKTEMDAQATTMALAVAAEAAVPLVLAEGKAKADEAAEAARAAFAAKFPAKVTPEFEAQIPAAVVAAMTEIATTTAETAAKALVTTLSAKHTDAAITEAFAELGPQIVAEAIGATVAAAARTAAESPIRAAATQIANDVSMEGVNAAAEELKESVGAKLAQASLERVGQALGDKWATWAVNNKLAAAVDEIMAKAPAPPS